MLVSATIKDPSGIPYAFGTYSFLFVPGGVSPLLNTGESVAPQSGNLDANGAFSGVTLGDTSKLGGGARWEATICSSTRPRVCFSTLLNITPLTPDLSATLSAAAATLSGTLPGRVAKRTWKTVPLIGASAQPVFGTYLTSPFNPSLPFLSVADGSLFVVGDPILIVETNGANQETGSITAVNGNNLTVTGLQNSHAANTWVVLNAVCSAVYIQRGTTQAANFGIGDSFASTLTGNVGVITVLYPFASPAQPPEFSDGVAFGPNFGNTSGYWVVGTAADDYLPSFSFIVGIP